MLPFPESKRNPTIKFLVFVKNLFCGHHLISQTGVTDENFVCCKRSCLDERWFECEEHDGEDNMDAGPLADVQDLSQYFETNDGVQINLEDVLLCMSDFCNELTAPPASFCMKDFFYTEHHQRYQRRFLQPIGKICCEIWG